ELFPGKVGKTSWNPSGSKETWRNLSLFLRDLSSKELQDSLELLKLSVKERRSIEEAWHLWHSPDVFLKKRLGQQLQDLQKDGIEWALTTLLSEDSHKTEIENIFVERKKTGIPLPKSFLTGEDLKNHLQGEAIGQCLQEAYCLQLEGKITARDKALQWLQSYLQNKKAH
ncbi:MAG TPA: hypothetical protein VN132_07460, partial [Bdellovibrio sp.]|nr:hypothetical protein [Bdellovibrio sp.]